MTDPRRALAVGLCAFTAGCGAASSSRTDVTSALSQPPGSDSAAIDDADLSRQLLNGARLLHEGGRTTPMATLIKQLARGQTASVLPRPSTERLSNRALYAKARASVLVIGNLYKCDKCTDWHVGQAGGFVITADGLAVTNHHVIDRASNTTLVAMTGDGQVFAVTEVVAASEADDLAVIRLDGADFTPLSLSPHASAGDTVRVVSHPDGELYSLSAGIVARRFVGTRHGVRVPILSITADFAKGSSGSPVMDDFGNAVGVVSYTRSVHHDNGKDHKRNLQMVIKNCTPADRLSALIVAP